MIIACPSCKKQFKIDPAVIPMKGRDLQCGTCGEVWFYKLEDKKSEPLSKNEDVISNELKTDLFDDDKQNIIEKKETSSQRETDIKEKRAEWSRRFMRGPCEKIILKFGGILATNSVSRHQ